MESQSSLSLLPASPSERRGFYRKFLPSVNLAAYNTDVQSYSQTFFFFF